MKPKIGMVTLGVADLERSLRFYRDSLGFSDAQLQRWRRYCHVQDEKDRDWRFFHATSSQKMRR